MSAQRASAPVRLARAAAAIVLTALAVVVIVRLAGRQATPVPPPVPPPPEGRVVDVKERVRHEEYEGGRLVAEIRGDTFFLGPDGRNHLTGSVEIANLGPAGEVASRLTAGEVVYEPGSLRFTVRGGVRVEAGDVVLEGESFEYDKTAGLFATTGGGRFASKAFSGRAPEISYRESADEVRLGGGFWVEMTPKDGTGRTLVLSGDSFAFERRELRGRVDGRAAFEGAAFMGSSAAASFVASEGGASLESAVFEGAAKVVFKGDEATGEGGGEIGADRIAVGFSRDPFDLVLAKTSDRSSLSFRSAADRAVTVQAQKTLLNFFRDPDSMTWSASGSVRAEITDAHGPGRALEGEEAVFDGARILHMYGRSGQAAVADSVEARIEAPQIHVDTASDGLLASGGVVGVLKDEEGRRKAGFFSPGEDVVFSCRQMELRPEISVSLFTANVLMRQGTDTLRAHEIELGGDQGRMSGAGGVAITLTEAAEGQAGPRTIELGGEEMAYRPDLGTLTLTTKAYVRLPEAGLVAEHVSAVIGRGGQSLESLTAGGGVAVSRGEYVGRSEAAAYQAASDQLTLTGSPVLTDGKGGSARGVKLTFDLADDKILLENEGPGRSTTIIRS